MEVAVGNYYLTIIKRASGKVLESLQEGDIYYLHRISVGTNKVISIRTGKKQISADWRDTDIQPKE